MPLSGGPATEQNAYIDQIHQSFIEFWAHICKLTRINLSSPAHSKVDLQDEDKLPNSHHNTMLEYFNSNCYDLLQSITLYLQRQLKVPEYVQIFQENEEFNQADFANETNQMFAENPNLLPKLQRLQEKVIQRIFDIIDMEGSEVRVSLLVYSSFKQLATADIKTEYRALEILRMKSSFVPKHN